MISRPHGLLATILLVQGPQCLPRVSLRIIQLNRQSKGSQNGPTACLFWLPGQKGLGSKHMPYSTPPTLRLLPQAQIHFPDSCGQLQLRSETSRGNRRRGGSGGSILAEHALAFTQISLVSVGVWQTETGQAQEAFLSRHSGMPLRHPPEHTSSLWTASRGAQLPRLDQPRWA